jgi:hypothetical protein
MEKNLFRVLRVFRGLTFSQKIFNYSVHAYQHPEKFYDERREIKIEEKRKNYQACADRV